MARPILICSSALIVMLASVEPVQAWELQWGGRVTLSGRTTEIEGHGDFQQTGVTTYLEGVGYLWRPWFATVKLKINLALFDSKQDQDQMAVGQQTDNRLLSGEARLNLFPQSRFPLEAFVDVFDSRIETDTVGVPLQDVNTVRRERVGMTQRYRSESGHSNYTVQALRSTTLENDGTKERGEDLAAYAAHRFDLQTVEYGASRSVTRRDEPLASRRDDRESFRLRHEARPSDALTVESVLDAHRDESNLELGQNNSSSAMALDNYVTWRPAGAPWTLRTHIGKQYRDTTLDGVESRGETFVGTASLAYSISRELQLRGDVGLNRDRTGDAPEVRRTFETVTLNYAPKAEPVLDNAQYSWGMTTTVGNSDTSDEDSVQSASVSVRHGINSVTGAEADGTLTSALNQAVTLYHDTAGTELTTLTHQGSVAAHWSSRTGGSLVQFNVSDARIRGQEATTDAVRQVNQTLQTADLHGNQQFAQTRFRNWEADARLGTTRDHSLAAQTSTSYLLSSVGYIHQHLFSVDRMRLRSRLEYSDRHSRSMSGGVESVTDEQRASWDSRLDYVVGLLTLSARRTYTQSDHILTTVTSISATRVF